MHLALIDVNLSINITSVIKQKVFMLSFNVLSPVSAYVSIFLGH